MLNAIDLLHFLTYKDEEKTIIRSLQKLKEIYHNDIQPLEQVYKYDYFNQHSITGMCYSFSIYDVCDY